MRLVKYSIIILTSLFITSVAYTEEINIDQCEHSFEANDIKALNICQNLAKNGNAKAQYITSQIYKKGLGTAPNEGLEITYLNKASNNNYVPAQVELAQIIFANYNSNHVKNTGIEGLKLIEKAANTGDAKAKFVLAKVYGTEDYKDLGVYDPLQSHKMLLKLYTHGLKIAGIYASHNFYDGFGTSVDKTKAINILNELAQEGYAPALISLSEIYMTDKDYINFVSGYAYYYAYANCEINSKHFTKLNEIQEKIINQSDKERAIRLGKALLGYGCKIEEL